MVTAGNVDRRRASAWARAALATELTRVRLAEEGARNHTLNSAAFALGQIVGGGHLDSADVAGYLCDAALDAGLGDAEARSTIASGLSAGAACPRHPGHHGPGTILIY